MRLPGFHHSNFGLLQWRDMCGGKEEILGEYYKNKHLLFGNPFTGLQDVARANYIKLFSHLQLTRWIWL